MSQLSRIEMQALEAQIRLTGAIVELTKVIDQSIGDPLDRCASALERMAEQYEAVDLRAVEETLTQIATSIDQHLDHQWRVSIGSARPAFRSDHGE